MCRSGGSIETPTSGSRPLSRAPDATSTAHARGRPVDWISLAAPLRGSPHPFPHRRRSRGLHSIGPPTASTATRRPPTASTAAHRAFTSTTASSCPPLRPVPPASAACTATNSARVCVRRWPSSSSACAAASAPHAPPPPPGPQPPELWQPRARHYPPLVELACPRARLAPTAAASSPHGCPAAPRSAGGHPRSAGATPPCATPPRVGAGGSLAKRPVVARTRVHPGPPRCSRGIRAEACAAARKTLSRDR